MILQENISLKPYNTFGVDAKAKYFAAVKTEEELFEILRAFNKLNEPATQSLPEFKTLPIMFLGGGSNVLFTKDFDGLVVKLDLKGITEEMMSEDEMLVTAKSGENWHRFVMYCLDKNYGGLENLSLIPGNVGTSPMQNIGAYGTEIKDTFVNCRVLNLEKLRDQEANPVETFDKEECRFGYRDSIFKQEGKDKYVILDVTFALTTRRHKIKTDYGAIKAELEKLGIENPTIQDVASVVVAIRQSKLPDPNDIGNAGSFFKNPAIPKSQFDALQKKFPDIHFYLMGELVKVPAGWLIEHSGWKGKQIGNVASHEKQALVIINKTGNATGKEIFDFSAMIIDSVKEKYGIELEREVNMV